MTYIHARSRRRSSRPILRKIGLRVRITSLPSAKMFAQEETPGAPFDLAWDGWIPDYPDPEAMLTAILEDSSDGPTFKDPAYQRKLAKAARLSGPERYLTYGKLDLDLARNAAPLAAFDNLTTTTSSPLESAARPTGSTASTSQRSASGTPTLSATSGPVPAVGAIAGRSQVAPPISRQPSPPPLSRPTQPAYERFDRSGKSPDAARTLGWEFPIGTSQRRRARRVRLPLSRRQGSRGETAASCGRGREPSPVVRGANGRCPSGGRPALRLSASGVE